MTSQELSPIAYQVLIALGDGAKHGYAILRDVEDRTEGRVRMLPGTLYSTLKRLVREELVESCSPPPRARGGDERRRFYRLTRRGRLRAQEETDRLAALVRLAREKGFEAVP